MTFPHDEGVTAGLNGAKRITEQFWTGDVEALIKRWQMVMELIAARSAISDTEAFERGMKHGISFVVRDPEQILEHRTGKSAA